MRRCSAGIRWSSVCIVPLIDAEVEAGVGVGLGTKLEIIGKTSMSGIRGRCRRKGKTRKRTFRSRSKVSCHYICSFSCISNLGRRWLAIIMRKKNLSSVGLIAIGTVRSQYASVSPARMRVPIPIERRWASGVVGSVKSFGNTI